MQIQIVNQRKQDLERRLKLANESKSSLSAALEESGDKILLLENLLNDKETKLGDLLAEVNELRDSSSWLSSELELMISLNEKLSMSRVEQAEQMLLNDQAALEGSPGHRKRSQLVEQLRELRLKARSRAKTSEMLEAGRLAAGRSRASRPATVQQRRLLRKRDASLFEELDESSAGQSTSNGSSRVESADDDEEDEEEEEEDKKGAETERSVSEEIYSLLRRFQLALQQRKDGLTASQNSYSSNAPHLYSPNSTTDDSGISGDDSK